jgi:transcriptional regulator with XRE-family HTH domain
MADEHEETPLTRYLWKAIEERRFDSERSFALHAGISPRTLGRILRGKKVDLDTLQLIAEGLRVPVADLYRLAGLLPPEEAQTQVLSEVEHLLRQLPEADQHRILEMVRLEHRYHQASTPGGGEEDRSGTG